MNKQHIVYPYSGILSNFKKEENFDMTHATACMNHEIILSEISHLQKDKYSVSTYEIPTAVKFIETKCQMAVSKGLQGGKWGVV